MDIVTSRGKVNIKDATVEELNVFQDSIRLDQPGGRELWNGVDYIIKVSIEYTRRLEDQFNGNF